MTLSTTVAVCNVYAEKTLSHVHKDSLSIVLDAVVDVAERDTAFEVRIFLVPDPGAFVNLVDKLDLEDVSSAVGGTYVEELDTGNYQG